MREIASFPPETVLFADIHGYTLLFLIALGSIRWDSVLIQKKIIWKGILVKHTGLELRTWGKSCSTDF